MRRRKGKRQHTRKPGRAVCGCTAMNGDPKTLFVEKFLASRTAGDTMGINGKMWETYKCPEGGGFHIATVRWDPWSKSESDYQAEAS